MDNNATKLITAASLAKRLSVSPSWLIAEAHAGHLPAVLCHNQWLFDQPAVEQELLARAHRRRKRVRLKGKLDE